MNIVVKKSEDYVDLTKYPSCEINCIHIQITDVNATVNEISKEIADTSWIDKFDELDKKIFQALSERTIDKIVNEILSGISSGLNEDIGEYLVSYAAQNAIVQHYKHIKIPLSELVKDKISGNPGFDFHTISTKKFLVFGEAKFSVDNTPRALALNQVSEFINLKKEYADMNSLRPFIDDEIRKNMSSDMKGFAAAFSFNAQNIDVILTNALQSEVINEIAKHNELFIVAVEVC